MIEVIPVGGFGEIGRNSCIIQYKDQAVMLDFGLHMENYINLQNRLDRSPSQKELIAAESVPKYEKVKDKVKNLKGICFTHAHLDHVGAIKYFAKDFDVPMHGTPFTAEVLKALFKDARVRDHPKINRHPMDTKVSISKDIDVEFITMTHSVPHSAALAVHTPDGTVVYTPDFKLDNAPTLGKRPNYDALKGLDNVKALMLDSLYAKEAGKSPSESIAREMLRDVLLGTTTDGSNIVTTTFSSQIARLKTIIELAEDIGRKPVVIGRSLAKYIDAAKRANIIDLERRTDDLVRYGGAVEKYFRHNKNTKDKLFIVTGHQGEPNAVLSRLVNDDIFPFEEGDAVIFSCHVIPGEQNIRQRGILEKSLEEKGLRIYKDVHSSGHARREDERELISMLNPERVIPVHGDMEKNAAAAGLAREMGYSDEKVHLLQNAEVLQIE